jgi:hypothetical protein
MNATICECRLPFNLLSLGLIVILHADNVVMNNIVKTFTFYQNQHFVTVQGDACWYARLLEDFELPAAGTCYFIPLQRKTNFSRIDRAILTFEFKHPLASDTDVHVYNLYQNYSVGARMMGLQFGS